VSILLTGCVSQKQYDMVVAENTELKAERMKLSEANLFLSGELLETDKEVMQLELTQEQLVDDVARWAAIGAVKMELLASGLHLVLPNDVLFRTGAAELKPEGRQLVDELVVELKKVPYQIVVIGHTDNVPIGPALAKRYPSNWELAGARSASVVRVMVDEGISPQQLVALSLGDTRPLVANDTEEGRAHNRRIEVRLRPIVIR
jgi:chemotaxis protein MotB